MFTVQVLCYGKAHHYLADRCLLSIVDGADWSLISDLRVCFNDSDHRLVERWQQRLAQLPVRVTLFFPEENVGKYPIMRRMLWQAPGSHLMWFDDDSHLTGSAIERHSWWRTVANIAAANNPCMVGSIWTLTDGFRPGQVEGFKMQPWYTGKEIPPKNTPRFCTGGWWVAPLDFLRKWDYPFWQIEHNCGDALLGELCHQQGLPLVNFRGGIRINDAKRRGQTSRWPWERLSSGQLFIPSYDANFAMEQIVLDPASSGTTKKLLQADLS